MSTPVENAPDGAPHAPAAEPAPPPPTTEPAAPATLLARIPLDHTPDRYSVHAALFRGVANAGFLHAQLLARNAAFEYALVDASAVAGTTQVLAAVFRAVVAAAGAGMRTPNVHSETVFCLSPSNNISEAYRRFGISPATRDVVVVKVLESGGAAAAADDVWRHLCANVEGTPVPFTDDNIALSTDWAKLRKYYKLNGAAGLAGIKDEAAKRKESEMLILGAMALRGV